MKFFKNKLFAVFVPFLFTLLLMEVVLRYWFDVGINNITYYRSNFYGYYNVPDQSVIRRNNNINLDHLGNRNPRNHNFENSKIIFLGDSITYGGSVVDDSQIFTYLIGNKLNYKYLNISSNGWGIINMINFLEYNNFYKENSIYIITCIDDCFTRNLRRLEQNFFSTKKDIAALIFFFRYFYYHFFFDENDSVFNIDKNFKNNIKTIEKSIQEISQLKLKLNSINSKLIVLHSPDLKYLSRLITKETDQDLQYTDYILDLLSKENINFYSIAKRFEDKELSNYKRFYFDSVHLNKEGHQLYSKIITEIINENK
jgi:hypothetical protein